MNPGTRKSASLRHASVRLILTLCQAMPDNWSVKEKSTLRCSFCLRCEEETAKIIAGPGSYICDACVEQCLQILGGEQSDLQSPEPDLPRWSTMTDEALLDRLPLIAASLQQVEEALEQWVVEARRRSASWARIGEALGISRQSAWERFVEAR
jgi:hypothetical protein